MESRISGHTQLFCLIGSPVGHSGSPAMYNYSFERTGIDAAYLAFNIPLEETEKAVQALKTLGVGGFNVTMPHKEAIVPYLDGLSGTAARCRAVNTVCIRDGRAIGYNTDGPGFVNSLRARGLEPEGMTALLLGTGGAGDAICDALVKAGVKKIFVTNRSVYPAKDLAARFGLDVKASELFFTCGAAPALISIIKALIVDADTEIMAIAPFFPEYRPFVNANGGKLVVVPADTKAFQIHLDEVEKRITKHTQAIIVNSPNNPSGVVYTEETLKGLASLLERKSAEYGHPIYIIADEPYRELVYGGVKVPFIPCLYKNTIVCYSYSKSLSLPGERIGYVYVPGFADDSHAVYAAIAGAARIMGHVCPPTLMQKVIELCAEERPDLAAYDENRNLLYNSLREMGYECAKPDGAFYLFVKAPNGDANEFSERAKLSHNLLVVPADGFGCPGYFRLSYCVSNDMIRRSLPAFKAMIESYK